MTCLFVYEKHFYCLTRFLLSIDHWPAPNAVRMTHPPSAAKGIFHPADVGVTKPIPYTNCITQIAPIRMMINPLAASLVKNPKRTAVAPNGSAIERSFIVNNKKGETLSGALFQKGIL